MAKERTTISVDGELLRKAQDTQINVSGLVEDAIRKKLVSAEQEPTTPDQCGLCGKFETKATAQNPIGLTWLSPDEIWICDKCLNIKKRHIGVRVH